MYNLELGNLTNVPFWLKGFAFSMYVVDLLNNLFAKHLPFPICLNDIDKSHPLYRNPDATHVIIVRFVRRDVRDAIFYSTNLIKFTGVSVAENLTADNKLLLKSAEKQLGSCDGGVCTDQGKIFHIHVNGRKTRIKDENDILFVIEMIGIVSINSKPPVAVKNTPLPDSHVSPTPGVSTILETISQQQRKKGFNPHYNKRSRNSKLYNPDNFRSDNFSNLHQRKRNQLPNFNCSTNSLRYNNGLWNYRPYPPRNNNWW